MAKDETLNKDSSLTGSEDAEKTLDTGGSERDLSSSDSSNEDEGKQDNLLPEGAKNFQHALQMAREREKASHERYQKLQEELARYREAEKSKKLSEMDEAEKWKTIAKDESEKRAKLQLELTVDGMLSKYDIPEPIARVIRKAPWAVPEVADVLGDSPTWDETIEAVKENLPVYLESLKKSSKGEAKGDETSSGESRVDTERSEVPNVMKKRSYTREELREISKDPEKWAKVEDQVLKDLAAHGGRLP